MPFMKGAFPIRGTLKYLQSSNLVLKERVKEMKPHRVCFWHRSFVKLHLLSIRAKVFTVNYNTSGDHHQGARDFVYWIIPQIQYKNPNVQVATFKNMTPSPYIRMFCEDGEDILVDIDSKSRSDIADHIKKIICKTDDTLAQENLEKQSLDNPANFGWGCDRQCICEISGQIPCPGVVPLPKVMRGKYKFGHYVE